MQKKTFVFIICLGIFALIIFSPSATSAFAHSGRTDSTGGHHDYDNVSGLGNYHYHHGEPAHLHKGGICPYKSDNATKDYSTNLLLLSFASFVVIVIVVKKRDKHNSKK